MLYQLGSVSFDVTPVNLHDVSRDYGSDYAAHPVIGAQMPRESVGQADGHVRLTGKMFPSKFGWGGFPALETMATGGTPQMLIRGDGAVLGWMCILHVTERHSYLDATGVGRIVEFDIEMVQSPTGASARSMLSLLGNLVSGFGA
jgi:phage protein U